MAQIIEMKPRLSLVPSTQLDVSGRISEFMHAFHLLDHAVLKTSYYNFDSRWQKGCRTWAVDGIEVDREGFEEHLAEWLRDRAMQRFTEPGTVLPMSSYQLSAK